MFVMSLTEQKSENDDNEANVEEDNEEVETEDVEEGSDKCVTHVGRKPLNGPPCSLKTLLNDGILEPANGALHIDYLVLNCNTLQIFSLAVH